jgi:hypothetical protein
MNNKIPLKIPVEIEISSDETGETLKRTSQKLTARRHR